MPVWWVPERNSDNFSHRDLSHRDSVLRDTRA
jgi:hypothetical protein